MQKIITKMLLVTLLINPLAILLPLAANAATNNWDTTGSYVINMNYLGTDYAHDMNLVQDINGNLTGNGGSPAGLNTYVWQITSGNVSDDMIDLFANYTATPDAVTPQTTIHLMGAIANDGTMSGTWSDNYQGGDRNGTWNTASGHATSLIEDEDSPTVKVTIVKYIDGAMATATSGQNMAFPMVSNWDETNNGPGNGQYSLSPSNPTPYQAATSNMAKGSDYSTSEVTTGNVVSTACTTDGTPYALVGYSTGNNLAQAQSATPSTTAPAFWNMKHDKFVIVRNITCNGNGTDGNINGTVDTNNGVLHVDSITVDKSNSSADGTFAGGWKYTFHITDPNNEPKISMKFSNWISGINTILVANNMRISSAQADNGGATILLTAANTYSTPALNMVTDLNPLLLGRQVDIVVEVSIPIGTVSGAYSSTYGIQSTP
jgi:hypothetical protein